MKKKIVLLGNEGGDWKGLYVDGECKYQNHSIDIDDILTELEIKIEKFAVSDDWMRGRGGFPNKLKEIPKKYMS